MNEIVDKYFQNGDSTVLVLKILESDMGKLIVCLVQSFNHNIFYLETYTKKEFEEWFLNDPMDEDFEFDPIIGKNLLH